MSVLEFIWKYQVRYRVARRLMLFGIFVMPPCRYKDEMLDGLWALYDRVLMSPAVGLPVQTADELRSSHMDSRHDDLNSLMKD